ncbi:hypothetical protein [Methylocapsa palsarum]|uniref:hypothetical protein n=1 Tax=Methylocapsa palsarum TaxID=1612308 RepID=UPI0011140AEB|nr:hypothetical protein [Methylocapsa palsarum]
MRLLEQIPIGLNQSNRQEYAQFFESEAISDRSHDFMRSESALMVDTIDMHHVAPPSRREASVSVGVSESAMLAQKSRQKLFRAVQISGRTRKDSTRLG